MKKIALIAVVLVVAVPILLGYAMAFEETERTVWKESNTRSISSVLYNDIKYDNLALNSYSLNSKIVLGDYYPEYVQIAQSPVTSLPIARESFTASDPFVPSGVGSVFFYGDDTVSATIVHSGGTATLDIGNMNFDGSTVFGTKSPLPLGYEYTGVTSVTFDGPYQTQYEVSSGSYADVTYGWRLNVNHLNSWGPDSLITYLELGTFTSIVMTMDFGEILESLDPGSAATFRISSNATNDDLFLTVHRGSVSGESYLRVYYTPTKYYNAPLDDSDFSKNTYQFIMDLNKWEAHYVGKWPGIIGIAPSLGIWTIERTVSVDTFNQFRFIIDDATESPIMRFDSAIREGFSFPVITNQTYDPATLMTDRTTASYSISLADIGYVGTSIGWGGQTFDIHDDAIVVNYKRIPLKSLVLESKFEDNTRTNSINGIDISTGANILELNGTWGAIVSLSELESETSTAMEWQPGEFAWNGVDESFALIGLVSSVAIFIGLGMYGRRSGAKVGMLMLITGCAAFIFLAMI